MVVKFSWNFDPQKASDRLVRVIFTPFETNDSLSLPQAHENLHAAIMQKPENKERISWWKECRQLPIIRDRSKLW